MVTTLELTCENTCPGKEIKGRARKAEGKANAKLVVSRRAAGTLEERDAERRENALWQRERQEEGNGGDQGGGQLR